MTASSIEIRRKGRVIPTARASILVATERTSKVRMPEGSLRFCADSILNDS